MKEILWYWVIGCIIVGLPMGVILRECPRDEIQTSEIAMLVLVWPSIIASLPTGAGAKIPPRVCKVAAP
jgi:hypothetical protein